MARIKYTCKNCGWSGSVVAEWQDIKPKKCPAKRCKTSFLKNPEKLQTELPKNELTRATATQTQAKESSNEEDFN